MQICFLGWLTVRMGRPRMDSAGSSQTNIWSGNFYQSKIHSFIFIHKDIYHFWSFFFIDLCSHKSVYWENVLYWVTTERGGEESASRFLQPPASHGKSSGISIYVQMEYCAPSRPSTCCRCTWRTSMELGHLQQSTKYHSLSHGFVLVKGNQQGTAILRTRFGHMNHSLWTCCVPCMSCKRWWRITCSENKKWLKWYLDMLISWCSFSIGTGRFHYWSVPLHSPAAVFGLVQFQYIAP